ncbi:MAG: hypothetical protein Q9M27_06720 [Mariprofundaceae bacterium]|jgi:hypothetical protein|nr:hypothetical protein [Mariprofundaceae bacterium]
MSFDAIISALGATQSATGRARAACPAHGSGKKLTLIITERDDGSTGIHCFAGCQPDDILAAVGLDKKEAWTPLQKYNSPQHRAACERSQRIIALTMRQRRDLAGIMAYLASGRPVQAVTLRRYDEIVVDLFHAVPRIRRDAREMIAQVQHEAIILALAHGDLMPVLNMAMFRRATPGEKNYQQDEKK